MGSWQGPGRRDGHRRVETGKEETTMIAFDVREPEHLAFLYEIYTRRVGNVRQGVPYDTKSASTVFVVTLSGAKGLQLCQR
jgi:hypothetical protein